jgi:hypothetical protein
MIQVCRRRCCPGCRPSMRAVWRSAKPATRTPTGGSVLPVYRPEAPSPPMRALELPLRPPTPRTRAKGLRAALPLRAPQGGRRERGDIDCAAPTGLSSRTHPLIRIPPRSVRERLAGPWRLAPRPRARRRALVLLHHHHQTRRHCHRHRHHHQVHHRHPGAPAASTAAGVANVPLPGSLQGPGPQVSPGINPPSAHWFSYHITVY